MSKVPARSTRVYLDHIPVYTSLNSSAQNISQATPSVECFGDNGPAVIVDKYDFDHDDMGFFEPEAFDTDFGFSGIDEEVWTRMFLDDVSWDSDADHYLAKMFGASAEGSPVYDSVIRISSAPRSAQVGGAVMMGFKSVGAGRLFRGLVLRNATVSGAGNGTGRNCGATAIGDTFRAVFRLVAFSGTDITMKIQQSSDDGGADAYTDIAGLTSGAMTEPGVVMEETTNETEAWKRVVISGTFTSAVVLVTAGTVS